MLEDIETCFFVNLNEDLPSNIKFKNEEFLNNQYILVKSLPKENGKISILIYSLTNTLKPLLRFENEEFNNITQVFFV